MNADRIEKETMQGAKKIAHLFKRLLFKAIKPFLPYLIIVILIFMILAMLVASVYSAMPEAGALGGVNPSDEDKKVKQEYEALCDRYNLEDAWLINDAPCEPGGEKYEASPDDSFYPGQGIRKFTVLPDPYGSDKALALKWGQVHAAALYRAYNFGQEEITHKEEITKGLHPYFYYKQSYVYTDGNSETEKSIQYLLVEAFTIEGHYQFHYKWVTETHGSGENKVTITKEELKDTHQLLPNKWQRLEDWLVNEYKLNKVDDVPLARTAVWEAGQGFNEGKEWLRWLIKNKDIGDFVSIAMIPPELIPYFKEAEERFGIPWWFLAAVAFKESSFNPRAENTGTHCYGLMQLTPSNWNHYSVLLGFDPIVDRENPRAQILCGAYMLRELGLKNIDWDGEWKEQTLAVLTFYGGFRGSDATERCREEYATPIWEYADNFRFMDSAIWPVPGYYEISSPFGPRLHSILNTWRDHDGIDIPAPMGQTVVSVSSGVVTHTGNMSDYGLTVVIQDGRHRYLYAHLSKISVADSQSVEPSMKIGEVGSTGLSDGPHLHLGIWDLAKEGWIDPMLVLRGKEEN
ncbi:Transglycosylase SLT domain-containing protein [Desulfotomaculum arcticum]|uniref:Transglycosylase SLT domain-containing protein n=1 Tax=Desulfotruncus arcticus DSM 17038 TaxID=1121424 RepID=A0A1I2Z9Z1_9FIRM|nr:peptidoglycan DD-metalloendopeptidase family protein [Desulfotruncus arcticus]SFH34326.1 Transglycosylase SLT domain-containing protein [Desulfotomaculum arcticum] [Desulfotruncus arcticus DSM 17038]